MKVAVETLESKTRTMARREHSRKLLTAKQELLEEALAKLKAHLEQLDDVAYGAMLDKLFAPLGDASGKIFAPKARLEVTRKHAPKNCEVLEDESLSGGFRAQVDGAEIDNSFDNLLFSEHKSALVTYLADSLNLV